MKVAHLLRQYRKIINPPYTGKDSAVIFATLFILISIPLTVILAQQTLRLRSLAAQIIVGPGGSYSTIQAAVDAAQAGDTILVKAGTYLEQVDIQYGPLTIRPYGDGEVILDGQCSREHGFIIWNPDSNPTANPVGVSLSGMTVQNTTSASVSFWYERTNGIRPGQGTVDGMNLRNFQCQGPPDGNQYHAAVAVYYGTSGFRITNNTIVGPTWGHASADGIFFKSNDSLPSGGGHYIAGNTISNVWDGIGGEEEASAHGEFDKDTIVENNTVTRCYDDGLNIEGGGANIIVRNNNVSGCGTGIALAAPRSGPIYVENNNIHDLILGDYGNLFCFKVGNESSATAYLTGNICDVDSPAEQAQGGADGISQTNDGLYKLIVSNNVFHTSRYIYQYSYDNPLSIGSTFDYDCMSTTDSSRWVKFGQSYYYTFPSFQSGTGQELHGQASQNCSSTPDTQPPVRSNGTPSGTLPAGTTQTTISLTTDEAATCKYGTTAGTSYNSLPNTFSTTGGTNHSSVRTGLTNGTSYTYYVRCRDTSPNANTNTDDYPISFSVASSSGKIGDLNGDNQVNIFDLSILLTRWGTTDPTADLNHNGVVDIFDLSILLTHWGT